MRSKTDSNVNQVLRLTKRSGVLRPRDLVSEGIPRTILSRLRIEGRLKQVARGLYVLPDAEVTEHHTLAQISKRFPESVVCLLSALQFHELTTQLPRQVWVAIPRTARQPRESGLPVRFVHFSEPAFSQGIEEYFLEKVRVKIYNVAKTVVDCFKYRNKIGLDVAVEGLRESLQRRRTTPDELMRYGRICRVARVMSPYIEAMLYG